MIKLLLESVISLLIIYIFSGIFFSSNFSDLNIFITDRGLLKQKEFFEFKKWSDFCSYKIIEKENLVRFKKNNDKFLFIEYKAEYFEECREEIISFLNKKLTME